MTILTDADGEPFPLPTRADFATDAEYVRAFHAYKDAVTAAANSAFDTAWRARPRDMSHVSEDYINRKYRR